MGGTMRMGRTAVLQFPNGWNHEGEKNSSEFFDMRGGHSHNPSEVKGKGEEISGILQSRKINEQGWALLTE
jgi:hypothetical protein